MFLKSSGPVEELENPEYSAFVMFYSTYVYRALGCLVQEGFWTSLTAVLAGLESWQPPQH